MHYAVRFGKVQIFSSSFFRVSRSVLPESINKNGALTFVGKNYTILLSVERRSCLPAKKMGRPTDDPKPIRLDIRISETDARILDDYCRRTGKRRPETIRDGIKSLKDK